MAKFCPNCGNEMVDEAAMCVKCGTMVGENNANKSNESKSVVNGEKKKGLPAWAIVLIVLGGLGLLVVIAIVVFVIIGVNALKKVDADDLKNKIENYIEENTESTLRGTIDDTLSSDEIKLTLTGAYMYDSIGEEYIPTEGKEYLLFFFEVENVSDDDKYISSYNFKGYADGISIPVKGIIKEVDGLNDLSADLVSGKKAKGFVAFEIPEDWQEFEIWYNGNSWGSKNLVFTVVNSEEGA